MALCELCGKTDSLQPVSIEGVQLSVCGHCLKYGQELGVNQKPRTLKPVLAAARTPELKIVDNYSEIIVNKRKQLGLTIAEFSKILNERESTVSKWQAGTIKPSLEQARKLERKLDANLIEKESEIEINPAHEKT